MSTALSIPCSHEFATVLWTVESVGEAKSCGTSVHHGCARYPCDCPSSLNMWQVDNHNAPVARPHRPRRARWSQNDVWLDSRKNAWNATPGRISSVNGAVGPPRFLFRGVGALRTLVLQGTFQLVETLRTGPARYERFQELTQNGLLSKTLSMMTSFHTNEWLMLRVLICVLCL